MVEEPISRVIIESLASLELPAVLEEVASFAVSSPGRQRVLSAQPEHDVQVVRSALDLVSQLMEVIGLDGALGMADLVPMEGMLSRLVNPAVILDAEEILAIGGLLETGGIIRERLGKLEERLGLLKIQASRIIPISSLTSRIHEVFDEHGLVRSTASRRLIDIRERNRSVRQRIRRRLERIVSDRDLSRIVQEDYVTLRNDRYVILLRPEFKGLLDGIVHDHSRSGASVYVEPLEVVELNNEVASLMDEEREEIRNILNRLTEEIRTHREEILANYDTLTFLDAFQARALYAKGTSCVSPELVSDGFQILGGRHPLLWAAGETEIVPMDVVQDTSTMATVISGANMGGKTVALKIAGLFPLMVRCGIMTPAQEGTRIQPFARIMADIGAEQDIRSRLSSFSGHMVRIKAILEHAAPGDLVLLDELGGATDPEEGAALSMAIIDELVKRNVRVVVTTHLTHLKAYALSRSDVKNVSVEFHPVTLKPTYRLLYDLPGESHAIESAERIGLDPGVIAAARKYVDRSAGGSSRLIENLRIKMAEVEERRLGLESTKRELEEQLAQLRADRAQIVEEFRLEAREMMRKAERQITQLQQSLKHGKVKPHKPREALKNISGEIVHVLGTPLEPSVTALEVGSRVKIKSLGRVGTVKGVLERGNVEVAVGNVTVRTNAEDLVLLDEGSEQKNASKKKQIGVDIPAVTPQWEVKVIGLRVEEALPIVEKALDKALVGGLRSISIIHGKGTGRLRQAVRDYLSQHALVRSFRSEDIRGGGEGVTVVELVSE